MSSQMNCQISLWLSIHIYFEIRILSMSHSMGLAIRLRYKEVRSGWSAIVFH